MNVLNVNDPAIKYAVLQDYGKTHLLEGMAADTKNADMEHEQYEEIAKNPQMVAAIAAEISAFEMATQQAMQAQGMAQPGMPPPPPPPTYDQLTGRLRSQGVPVPRVRAAVDDHAIHSKEHGTHLKTETAMGFPEPLQRLEEMHKGEHDRLLREAQGVQPPKVSVALRGELPLGASEHLAGLPPSAAPPRPTAGGGGPAQGGSGLLSNPTRGPGSGNAGRARAARGQNPMRTGSSGNRLAGEMREMAQKVQ
jgi:hypothetical protein